MAFAPSRGTPVVRTRSFGQGPARTFDRLIWGLIAMTAFVLAFMTYYLNSQATIPPYHPPSLHSRSTMEITKRIEFLSADLARIEGEISKYTDQKTKYAQDRDAILSEYGVNPVLDQSLSRFRNDGRCGPQYPAPGAKIGECDPKGNADQVGPCCRGDSGYCGNERNPRWGHCYCATCVDYAVVDQRRQKFMESMKRT